MPPLQTNISCCKFMIDALDQRFKLLCTFFIIDIRRINLIKSRLQISIIVIFDNSGIRIIVFTPKLKLVSPNN